MIKMKVLDSDASSKVIDLDKNSALWNNKKTSKENNNSGYKTIKINMEGKTQTLYKNGVVPSKSPSGKCVPSKSSSDNKVAPSKTPSENFAPSLNLSNNPKGRKGYNVVKINIGGKTNVIQDDSKELDIMIPKKLEKKHRMKLRNRNKIN